MITQKLLLDRFSYCKITGEFRMKYSGKRRIGKKNHLGFLTERLLGSFVYLDKLAFLYVEGFYPEEEILHFDGDRSNNAWDNIELKSRTKFDNLVYKIKTKNCSRYAINVRFNDDYFYHIRDFKSRAEATKVLFEVTNNLLTR